MKKLFFIIFNIFFVFVLPKLSFSYPVDFYYNHYDGFILLDSGEYALVSGNVEANDLSFPLYIEPSEIYTNGKALVDFNLQIDGYYSLNIPNDKGFDFTAFTQYNILANTGGNVFDPTSGTNIWEWEYTGPLIQVGTQDYTDFQLTFTSTLTVPMLFDTGISYNIFPSADPRVSGIDSYSSGDFEVIGGFEIGSRIGVLSYDVSPVPEPSTLLLLGSGLVGLVGFGRKKFKR